MMTAFDCTRAIVLGGALRLKVACRPSTPGMEARQRQSGPVLAGHDRPWQDRPMILLFCAFEAEFTPLRARLQSKTALGHADLEGCYGRIGNAEVALVKTGIGMRRAREAASRALGRLHGTNLVAITGVAGALREGLPVGRVVLADRLMTRREESFHPDRILDATRDRFDGFGAALTASGIEYATGPILTSRRAIAKIADKRLAADQSGAVAVDMESAMIALEAHRRGLPFVCMRTILDTAAQELAGAMLADEYGRVRPLAAAKALLSQPSIVAGALRLVRNLRIATDRLAAAAEAVLTRIE
jgi:nucleoside phosphorylase